jgi:hypothetical protein
MCGGQSNNLFQQKSNIFFLVFFSNFYFSLSSSFEQGERNTPDRKRKVVYVRICHSVRMCAWVRACVCMCARRENVCAHARMEPQTQRKKNRKDRSMSSPFHSFCVRMCGSSRAPHQVCQEEPERWNRRVARRPSTSAVTPPDVNVNITLSDSNGSLRTFWKERSPCRNEFRGFSWDK